MAFPTVASRTESTLTTAGTSFTVNFTQTTGDLVVIILGLVASGTISLGDSFTNLTGASDTLHLVYKVLDGSEGGNVVITIPSGKACAIAYNIQGFSGTPEFSTVAGATNANPNSIDLTPAGGSQDYLWLSCFRQAGEEADDDTWVTGTPAGWSNLTQTTTGTGGAAGTNCQVASMNVNFANSTLNPDPYTTAQSLAWRAYTVAINPTGGGGVTEDPFPYVGGGYYPNEG